MESSPSKLHVFLQAHRKWNLKKKDWWQRAKPLGKKGRVGVSVWNNEDIGVRPCCLSFCIYQFTSANPHWRTEEPDVLQSMGSQSWTRLSDWIPATVPATINTGNYIQYPVIINNGKEYKKEFVCVYIYIYIYMYNWVTWLYCSN